MKRQTKKEEVFRKPQSRTHWNYKPFTVADITAIPGLLPTDEITIEKVEAWDYGDSSSDGYTHLLILRERPYTDDEQAEFEQGLLVRKAELREERYTTYLRLREEFAPTQS